MVPLIGWAGARIYQSIIFDKDCGGYLKRAADANTVEMAEKQLQVALSYLEQHNLTQGYTSIIYNTPDEDIGFWYDNLRESLNELQNVNVESSQLERSNVLMKLRETLLDQTDQGDSLTKPEGIAIYPHNMIFMICGIFGLVMVGVAGLFFMRGNYTVTLIEIMIIIAILSILSVAIVIGL